MVRIKSLLKQEISLIIQQKFRQNLGLISIIDINIAKDLKNATVYYSHFGSEKEQKKTYEKLNKANYFIHEELNKIIRLKQIPKFIFQRTNHLENGTNLINTMNSLSNESNKS